MLKGVPKCLSPDLLHALRSMGHGDEIVIADGNFPAASNAKRLIRADGLGVLEVLRAVVKYLPLDQYVMDNVCVMQVVPGDTNSPARPPIWNDFESTIKVEEEGFAGLTEIERHDFYERARSAYAVVATSETAIYANIILKKGVVHNAQ